MTNTTDGTTTASKSPVDKACPLASTGAVHGPYDCMLNQTNIGANNNKFYVIQLVEKGGKFYVWNRWGRVGEDGQNALKGPLALEKAIKEFEAKFKDKTGNAWSARNAFKAVAGRYTMIEIDTSADAKKAEEREAKLKALDAAAPKVVAPDVLPSALPAPTQALIKLIFDKDMFQSAMKDFEIDVEKMPLGQLSKSQVQRGFEALEALETALKASETGKLVQLSSAFYTLIPHAFGRRKPPVIGTAEMLQKKKDMLNVLSDIELALGMEKSAAKPAETVGKLPNPMDQNYAKLDADLVPVDVASPEFAYVAKYLEATAGGRSPKVLDVFKVHRRSEPARFAAHDGIEHRKLLWHGTNVAVVAAILGSGLRIMPHSGGRVGRGIYLASENGKSAGYVGCAGNVGIMFLAEAALGKEHHIHRDDSSLRHPPKGFDSIVAKGHTEPDPADDITVEFDGKPVIVPQGKPVKQAQWSKSSFTQSEYLLYQESQVRLRYVLKLKMY